MIGHETNSLNHDHFKLSSKLLILIPLFLLISSSLSVVCSTDLILTISPNQYYHESTDPFSIELIIENNGLETTVDVYFAVEVLGEFYFFPSFGKTLDALRSTIPAQDTLTIPIVPTVTLPENLPLVVAQTYAVCTEPETYNLVSNLDMTGLFLQDIWPELPFPTMDNSFYFLPGDRSVSFNKPQSAFDEAAEILYTHFPLQGPYRRMGISYKDPVRSLDDASQVSQVTEKAANAGLAVGVHVDTAPHHLLGHLEALRQSDRRYNQWEGDGRIYNSGFDDLTCITLSRYATEIHHARSLLAQISGEGFVQALQQYPDHVVYINGPIEVELRRSLSNLPHYADYSPLSIAEFRDWICHKGLYDDDTGTFAGEGVFRFFIDDLDFSDDPSPDVHIGEGPSFNEYFGTYFTRWDLKYWDPYLYPDPLPLSADPKPAPCEPGYLNGGFDAPREVNGILVGGNAKYHEIWDGFYSALGYGFRQMQVMNYVTDHSRWLYESGVPVRNNFTHQIPCEFLNNWIRLKSSASPFWTAWNVYSGLGFTTYWETVYEEILFQISSDLSPRWGLFEYHPDPYMTHTKDYFAGALELVYKYRAQILCPLFIHDSQNGDYALLGTPFEEGLAAFFSESWEGTSHGRFDQPYFNKSWVDFLPPLVRDIQFSDNTLTWSPTIWTKLPEITWDVWGEFDRFDIFKGSEPNFIPNRGNRIASTFGYSMSSLEPGHYKVMAISKLGVSSPVY